MTFGAVIFGAVIVVAATCCNFGAVILGAVMCFGFCCIWNIGVPWEPPWDALRSSFEALGVFWGGAWKPCRLTGRVLCHSQGTSGSFGSPWRWHMRKYVFVLISRWPFPVSE